MRRFRFERAALVAVLLGSTTSVATAREPGWFSRCRLSLFSSIATQDSCAPAPLTCCNAHECDDEDDDDRDNCLKRHWRQMEPPRGPVLSSVPAVMVAQHAVPVDFRGVRGLSLGVRPHADDLAAHIALQRQAEALSALRQPAASPSAQAQDAACKAADACAEDRLKNLEARMDKVFLAIDLLLKEREAGKK